MPAASSPTTGGWPTRRASRPPAHANAVAEATIRIVPAEIGLTDRGVRARETAAGLSKYS